MTDTVLVLRNEETRADAFTALFRAEIDRWAPLARAAAATRPK